MAVKAVALSAYLETNLPASIEKIVRSYLGPEAERTIKSFRKGIRGRKTGYEYQVYMRILDTIAKYANKLKRTGIDLDDVAKTVTAIKGLLTLPDLLAANKTVEQVKTTYGEVVADIYKQLSEKLGKEDIPLLKKLLSTTYEKYRKNLSALLNTIVKIYLEKLKNQAPVTIVLKDKYIPGFGYQATVSAKTIDGVRSVEAFAKLLGKDSCLVESEGACLVIGKEYGVSVKIPTSVIGSSTTSWALAAGAYPLIRQAARGSAWNSFEIWFEKSNYNLTFPEIAVILASKIPMQYHSLVSYVPG